MKQTQKVTKEKVLLTGISGYIGLYCAKELLEAGFSVRGTVRNLEKKKQVLDTLGQKKVNTKNLEFLSCATLYFWPKIVSFPKRPNC